MFCYGDEINSWENKPKGDRNKSDNFHIFSIDFELNIARHAESLKKHRANFSDFILQNEGTGFNV